MKIMSYNIHSGKTAQKVLSVDEISKVIADQGADICALNEVCMGTTTVDGMMQAPVIAQKSGMPYWRFGRAIDHAGGEYGIAMLSRYPIIDCTLNPVPDVPEGEREKNFEPRTVLSCTVETEHGPMRAVTSHFGLSVKEQANAVQTVLSLPDDLPMVFMGDLNVEPNDEVIAKLRGRFTDTAGDEPLTFPADQPHVRIDYIFASKGLKAGPMQTIESQASDHLPVIAHIDF